MKETNQAKKESLDQNFVEFGVGKITKFNSEDKNMNVKDTTDAKKNNIQNSCDIPATDYDQENERESVYSHNLYSSLEEDKENRQNGHFMSSFNQENLSSTELDAFPQPPSLIKISSIEINLHDHTESKSSSTPPAPPPLPPPPPPPLPPFISKPNIDETNHSKLQLNSRSPPLPIFSINSEALLNAKQKLKIQTDDSDLNNEKSNTTNEEKKVEKNTISVGKKNEFLLQEIHNHRLFNTKKDYVLDYLDRSVLSSVTYNLNDKNNNNEDLNSSNRKSSENKPTFQRTLSNSNINPKINEIAINNKNNEENKLEKKENNQPGSVRIQTPNITTEQNRINYDRFPHLRNKTISNKNNSENYKRTQSTSCLPNTRVPLPSQPKIATNNTLINQTNKPVKNEISLINNNNNNNLSVSMDNLNKKSENDQLAINSQTNNQVKSILSNYENSFIKLKQPEKILDSKTKEHQPDLNDLGKKNSINSKREASNLNGSRISTSSRGSTNSINNHTNNNKKIFEILNIRNSTDPTAEINTNCNNINNNNNNNNNNNKNSTFTSNQKLNKQTRHFQQTENAESELDRVFKV